MIVVNNKALIVRLASFLKEFALGENKTECSSYSYSMKYPVYQSVPVPENEVINVFVKLKMLMGQNIYVET